MWDFIYCQRDIPKEKWRYGFRSSAVTGCGWIATYNALLILGKQIAPEKLIRFYERQFPLINGNMGTFLFSPFIFFKRHGYKVRCTVLPSHFDKVVDDAEVCVLYYWWRNKCKFGAHFVALHKTDKGIIGYNTFRTSKGPDFYGKSLETFMKNRKYFCGVLFGIQKK